MIIQKIKGDVDIMNLKKFKKVVLMSLAMSTFIVGCAGESGNSNTTTTKEEVSTKEKETTTTAEITTQEPTTEEFKPDKYPYKGKMFLTFVEVKDYFDGFIVNPGDKIYLNNIWSGKSYDDDYIRGEVALCLHGKFDIGDELIKYEDKYMSPAGPYVPYDDNYFIEYKGKKIQFIYIGEDEDGVFSYFDMITIE